MSLFKPSAPIVKYKTGTAVWFKHHSISLTCPCYPQLDSAALYILSRCQHKQTRNMITERHNLACRMIFKAISRTGYLGSCFVCVDIGSSKRLAMQNLQTPDTAETRIILKWLFPPHFSDKNWFASVAVLVAPISTKTKKQHTSNEGGGWVLRSGRERLRGTGSISAAPPATSRFTFPRQHRPKDLSILHVMLNQWHGQIVWFPLGFIMWATVLRLFGCLASWPV
jgi:hypothetical protein